MAKLGKRLKSSIDKVEHLKRYSVGEAIDLVLDTANAKFDESIDVSVRLGVDTKHNDQQVRGAVSLPHGLGKEVRVIVFARGPKEKEAKDAGADYVGADDLVEKIQGGWMDFDKVLATPDMMAVVKNVAKILGPRGMMPNPKVGTVTMNVGQAVASEKKGKLAFRAEKAGIIHASVGRKSMGKEKLKDNFMALMSALSKAKPSASKGIYFRGINVSSTMGPGVRVDVTDATASLI